MTHDRISDEWLNKMIEHWGYASQQNPNDAKTRDVWKALLDLEDIRARMKGLGKTKG